MGLFSLIFTIFLNILFAERSFQILIGKHDFPLDRLLPLILFSLVKRLLCLQHPLYSQRGQGYFFSAQSGGNGSAEPTGALSLVVLVISSACLLPTCPLSRLHNKYRQFPCSVMYIKKVTAKPSLHVQIFLDL